MDSEALRKRIGYDEEAWFWLIHEFGIKGIRQWKPQAMARLKGDKHYWNWWRMEVDSVCRKYWAAIDAAGIGECTNEDLQKLFVKALKYRIYDSVTIIYSFNEFIHLFYSQKTKKSCLKQEKKRQLL